MTNNERYKTPEERKVRYPRTNGAWLRHKRLYGVWNGMIHRCEDTKRQNYDRYGGRGITVCAEWHDANVFINWGLASGYAEGLQLDRKNNDAGYYPENCHWITRKQNCRNTRRNKFITLNGETKTIAEWKTITGISEYTMYWWYSKFGKEGCESRVIAAWNRRAK